MGWRGITVEFGSSGCGSRENSGWRSNVGGKTSHLEGAMKGGTGVLNFDPEGDQSVHLLVQHCSFLHHLLHFPSVELLHLVQLIVQSLEVHQLVLPPFVGAHQERRFVSLRPSTLHRLHRDVLALDVTGGTQRLVLSVCETTEGSVQR